uniref:Transmembrane protein n=1 Tax=Heterorhabditis bacteriophora TaxID=37862 RepID=A0A1I7WXP1_HETBA
MRQTSDLELAAFLFSLPIVVTEDRPYFEEDECISLDESHLGMNNDLDYSSLSINLQGGKNIFYVVFILIIIFVF